MYSLKNWTNLVGFTDQFNRFFPLLTFLQFFFNLRPLFFFLSFFNHKSYHHHHHQRFTHSHTHADKMNFKIGNLKLFPLTWLHLTYSYRRIAQPHCLLEETHPIFSPFHISFPSTFQVDILSCHLKPFASRIPMIQFR